MYVTPIAGLYSCSPDDDAGDDDGPPHSPALLLQGEHRQIRLYRPPQGRRRQDAGIRRVHVVTHSPHALVRVTERGLVTTQLLPLS